MDVLSQNELDSLLAALSPGEVDMDVVRPEKDRDERIRKFLEPLDNTVSHPTHYTQGSIECIDAMEAAFGIRDVIIFCKLNAFKYIWRCKYKGKEKEDIGKAVWYLNRSIELLEKEADSIIHGD